MADDGLPMLTITLKNVANKPNEKVLSGRKIWQKPDSVQDSDLPEVTIKVEATDHFDDPVTDLTQTQTLKAGNNKYYKFTGLPIRDSENYAYHYEITEEFPEEQNGLIFTQVEKKYNTDGTTDFYNRVQQHVTLHLVKNWEDLDSESLRPKSISLNVIGKASGNTVSQVTVDLTAEEGWTADLTEMPRWYYSADGVATEIEYTVEETTVSGYETATVVRSPESGYVDREATYTLTNTLTSTMNVTVEKRWLGSGSEPVTIWLKGSCGTETKVSYFTLTEADGWKHTVKDLPHYGYVDGELTEWTWTVEEEAPEGWELAETTMSEKTGSDGTVTRTYVLVNSQAATISGRKLWQKPEDMAESDLPDVTVTLKVKNGWKTVTTRTAKATAENGWTYTFTDVPTGDGDGNIYTYEITEPETIPVSGGSVTKVSEEANSTCGKDFTNRWQSWETITLRKTWKDSNDLYATRPDSVTFRVTGKVNGKKVSEEIVRLTKKEGWSDKTLRLPLWYYAEGEDVGRKITYTVTEDATSGYTTALSSQETDGGITYTAVNTLLGGSLAVTNTVINGSTVLPFTYRIVADLSNGMPLVGEVDGLTFDSQGQAVFTLKHEEEIEVLLPQSVTVEVTQDAMPDYTTTKKVTTETIDPTPMKVMMLAETRAGGMTVDFTNDLHFTIYGRKTLDSQEPGDATFTYLLLDDQGEVLEETTNGSNGDFSFNPEIGLTDQSELTLTVREAEDEEQAEAYLMDTEPRTVTVTLPEEGGAVVSADEENPVEINNHTRTQITVYKVWEDDADLNIAGQLSLYADDEKLDRSAYQVTVDSERYAYTFTGIPLLNEEGKEITYTVKESAPSGYMTVYPDGQSYAGDGDTIRNILAMTLTVKKEWRGTGSAEKPSITLHLYRDGKLYHTYERKPNATGVYSFTVPLDLDSEYWFVEEDLPGYIATYSNQAPHEDVIDRAYNGGTIINTGTKMPNTGDGTPILALSLAAMLSLGGLVLLRRRRW